MNVVLEHVALSLPCPHCGGQRWQSIIWDGNIADFVTITCTECDAPDADEPFE